VSISEGDVYQVAVDNNAGHYNFIFWVADNNTISGDFYLRRNPVYLFALEATGATLLIVGVALVPSAVVVEYERRRRAESLYECPRCHKKVRIGVITCPYCKIDLTKYWVKCKYCGKLFDSHLEKCPKCGHN
jgi:RNA polymerase subunit RPABC4/transcription elongation factor Spt4